MMRLGAGGSFSKMLKNSAQIPTAICGRDLCGVLPEKFFGPLPNFFGPLAKTILDQNAKTDHH